MRNYFVLTVLLASNALHQSLGGGENVFKEKYTWNNLDDDHDNDYLCRNAFFYYKGWCVYKQYSLGYQISVSTCDTVDAYAPSIHSDKDVSFWSGAVCGFDSYCEPFWLDAFCRAPATPYAWLDGTPTDYLGPEGELKSCTMNYGFLMMSTGFALKPYQTNATTFCAYIVQPTNNPTYPTTPQKTSCRQGFSYWDGWCEFDTAPSNHYYDDSVAICSTKGSFAPSIHSKNDLDYWSKYASVLASQTYPPGFWLDANCTSSGSPYTWLDGTLTDYFGPSNELKNCELGVGLIIQRSGFVKSPNYKAAGIALCLQSGVAPQQPTTTPIATIRTSTSITTLVPSSTTVKPTTKITTTIPSTTSKTSTITPDATRVTLTTTITSTSPKTIDYCLCTPSTVYLDIAFVVDTSDGMTESTVDDATATIQSALYGLTFGTGKFQSNIAVLAFADTVQIIANFGDFTSTKNISSFSIPFFGGSSTKLADAIKEATSMISLNGRSFSRGVIILISKSFNGFDTMNIDGAASAFKEDGGILITIDYSKGGIKGLSDIASPGFNIMASYETSGDILYALCDANCFCNDGFDPYNTENERGREVPNSCYHVVDSTAVYDAAETNCAKKNGFVATIHDDGKNFYLTSLFPVKTPYWIGFERSGNEFEWADGSTDQYTNWAPANPIDGLDCVYGQQQTGFNAPWFSAPCTDPLKNSMAYACQIRPCSSEFDCWA